MSQAQKVRICQRIVFSNRAHSCMGSSELGCQGGGGPRPPGVGAERRIEERFGGAESAMVGKQEVVKVPGELAERLKAPDSKSGGPKGLGGSNPSLSAKTVATGLQAISRKNQPTHSDRSLTISWWTSPSSSTKTWTVRSNKSFCSEPRVTAR